MKHNSLADLFDRVSRWLVLTGAGVSTASGIGDYRDEHGQWKRAAPIMHQDFVSSLATRQRYWARSQLGFPQFAAALPNTAHHTLAALEQAGRVSGLITQNVDSLHQRAGHQSVVDLHGNLSRVVCLQCGQRTPRTELQHWLEAHNPDVQDDFYTHAPDGDADTERVDFSSVQVPVCTCGGVLKPDVVFYGDNVARAVVERCYQWVDEAQGLLVVGSSLMVYSGFRFVRRAAARGIPVLGLNRGVTRGDHLFSAKSEQDCAPGLAQLLPAARNLV